MSPGRKYYHHHPKYTKYIPNIYIYIYTHIQTSPNISKIYKDIPNSHGTDRDRHLGAGPGGAAPPPLGFLYTLVCFCMSWIYLDIFAHIVGIYIGYVCGYLFGGAGIISVPDQMGVHMLIC